MLVLLGSLKEEIAGLRGQMIIEETLTEYDCCIYKGKYKSKDILLVQTGMGKESAERAAEFILERYPATALISLGFAGALVEDLRIGDVVLSRTLYCGGDPTQENMKMQSPICSDADLVSTALGVEQVGMTGFFQVSSVTMAKPIGNSKERLALGKNFNTKAVDMESYWIARIASARGIPFLSVRAVSDTVRDTLPPFDRFLISGKWQWDKATIYFLTHPRELIKLYYLYRNSRQARRNLTAFMDSFITRYETS